MKHKFTAYYDDESGQLTIQRMDYIENDWQITTGPGQSGKFKVWDCPESGDKSIYAIEDTFEEAFDKTKELT